MLAFLASTTGCAMRMKAPPAAPTVVARASSPETTTRGTIRVLPVQDRELCDSFGVREFCVQNMNEALRTALRSTLRGTMTVVDHEHADYTAVVEPVAMFLERNAWNNHVRVELVWKLTVRSKTGATLIYSKERTTSPRMVPFDDVELELHHLEGQAITQMRKLFEESFETRTTQESG